jgi:hypothetical protein
VQDILDERSKAGVEILGVYLRRFCVQIRGFAVKYRLACAPSRYIVGVTPVVFAQVA